MSIKRIFSLIFLIAVISIIYLLFNIFILPNGKPIATNMIESIVFGAIVGTFSVIIGAIRFKN
jgi:hypothetical protein